MAPKQPSKTTTTTEVKLPEWVDKASKENYDLAKLLGGQEFEQYTGQRVADLDPTMKNAFSMFENKVGRDDKTYMGARNIFANIADAKINPGTVNRGAAVTKGQMADVNYSKYMNPYINEVSDKSMQALNDSRMQALMGNSDAAQKAGAFGSSRHGIVDAVTNAESAKDAGLLEAQLRSDAFTNAQGAAQFDINGKYDADVYNRNSKYAADVYNNDNRYRAQMDKLQAMQTGATGMIGAADARQNSWMKDFAGMTQIGNTRQMQDQRVLDSEREKFGEKRAYDLENLNLRLSALGMSPYGKTENGTKITDEGSSGTDWMQGGLGILSLLMGLSEDDTKTDKEKVGKVPGTDLDLWAYRYKKDPKTYPKVVGIMASDIQKKHPEAVEVVDGKRIVNYGLLSEILNA